MKNVTSIRCAIYTRKSSEEGLAQSFNSLHAQREACEAYIKSQQSEGWKVLPEEFDDGGFSGGTMERPSLTRLLDKICAGQIDVVVVYKVDRLSRSLADFVRLVELFEKHHVSFVSVTQHFNTSTSMGRLTLNVLLSFAQFEREVTGERIRDKIAASKKKGMWLGGPAPLGYDIVNKCLVVNPKEAKVVKYIYDQYHCLGSVKALKALLQENNIKSKCRVSKAGNQSGGADFTRGALYLLLKNPVYIGKVRHKDQLYEGSHEPIIEDSLWTKVQARIKINQHERRLRTQAKNPSILAGLLWDNRGHPMSPSFTSKGQRRYRYYVNQAVLQFKDNEAGSVIRISALEIETPVLSKIEQLFSSADEVLALLPNDLTPPQMVTMSKTIKEVAHTLHSPSPHPKIRVLKTLVHRIVVSQTELIITIKISGLKQLLGIAERNTQQNTCNDGAENELSTWNLPITFHRHGGEVKLILGHCESPQRQGTSATVQGLQRALRKALSWNDAILSGKVVSLVDIAKQEKVTQRYIAQMIRLAYLAPDIQEAIFQGNIPTTWTVDQFREAIPLGWQQQRLKFPLHPRS